MGEGKEKVATQKTEICPNCQSDKIAQIFYGRTDFTPEFQQSLAKGEIVLGGCAPKREDRACLNCKTRFKA
jgi:hypothetical protein